MKGELAYLRPAVFGRACPLLRWGRESFTWPDRTLSPIASAAACTREVCFLTSSSSTASRSTSFCNCSGRRKSEFSLDEKGMFGLLSGMASRLACGIFIKHKFTNRLQLRVVKTPRCAHHRQCSGANSVSARRHQCRTADVERPTLECATSYQERLKAMVFCVATAQKDDIPRLARPDLHWSRLKHCYGRRTHDQSPPIDNPLAKGVPIWTEFRSLFDTSSRHC